MMFDTLFSFQFFWISGLLIALSTALAFFCTLLHKHLLYITVAEWLAEHVYCPVAKALLLMLMAILLFPLAIPESGYGQLFQLFIRPEFLIQLLNTLLFGSLVFTFLPLLKHAVFAMPVLACMATGLLFLHQVAMPAQIKFNWFPSAEASGWIVLLILITTLISRWLNEVISQWIDQRYIVSGSKSLVSDVNYLIFQIPLVLTYAQSLSLQLPDQT